MGQVTIYLPASTEKKARKAAASRKLSLSKWIATTIDERTAAAWPPGILELSGTWKDFPSLAEIRATKGKDIPREEF